jgi:hypothetical protein
MMEDSGGEEEKRERRGTRRGRTQILAENGLRDSDPGGERTRRRGARVGTRSWGLGGREGPQGVVYVLPHDTCRRSWD